MTQTEPPELPGLRTRIETALEHARLLIAHEAGVSEWHEVASVPTEVRDGAELRAIRSLRGQLPMYIKGEVGAAQIRARITSCDRLSELEEILEEFAAAVANG